MKDYISFDEGHRVESFAGFQNETQFEPEALRLGQRAAAEVQRYRTLFPNVESVCKYYLQRPLKSPRDWQNFHSGVACALAGNLTDAVRFFDLHLIPDPDQPEWFVDRQADAKNLKELAPNLAQFRSTIANRVRRARELQKLPPWAVLDFDGPSHP
ncbi:MAG TPA: hypothetical protein VFW23_17950 [Tepidisphaeraceae bacterium]|nr:hypothetical protein [Tepidisphaeraceae bacterium]